MRTLARRLALPATALVAALALTACQSDGTPAAAKPNPAKPASATSAAPADGTAPTPRPTASAAEQAARPTPTTGHATRPGTKPDAKPASKPTAKPGGGTSSDQAVITTCTASHTKIVASKVSRPVNHLVLSVTNVGSRPCNALNAPFVGFDDAQATIRTVEDSKPQAVVTLMPGETGYASVILTGEPGPDTHGRAVRTIKVYLTEADGKTVTAPSGTFADDGAAVSYWQRTLEEALTY
ncbi:DUF4232 domain-containing protein [Streptomyces sp. NPDC004327]|uniref:DUF4232 domain-containing protein n=1 Tax=unclassified Streptomyces TaxID=2593676 RepID=UPI00369FE2DC